MNDKELIKHLKEKEKKLKKRLEQSEIENEELTELKYNLLSQVDRLKKEKWLEIKKHPISGKKYERIMVYTPSTVKSELAMKYRLIDVDSGNLMKDATHWMKIEPPE